mgnify:CR=1 FL=1
MKRNAALAAVLLLAVLIMSACAPAAPGGQTSEDLRSGGNGSSADIPDDWDTDAPDFFEDLGKTLSELKQEHPDGELAVDQEGFPENAAACFEEAGADYAYFFFGMQSGDAEKAMNERADQLKCAGFITTVGVLFADMKEDMSFADFFALISVDDYEYFGEDPTAGGWLKFVYRGMEVMVNTNEPAAGGGWDFTGAETVKPSAPVSIADKESWDANQKLADAVMFG